MRLFEHFVVLGHGGPADAESGGLIWFGDDVEMNMGDNLVG